MHATTRALLLGASRQLVFAIPVVTALVEKHAPAMRVDRPSIRVLPERAGRKSRRGTRPRDNRNEDEKNYGEATAAKARMHEEKNEG